MRIPCEHKVGWAYLPNSTNGIDKCKFVVSPYGSTLTPALTYVSLRKQAHATRSSLVRFVSHRRGIIIKTIKIISIGSPLTSPTFHFGNRLTQLVPRWFALFPTGEGEQQLILEDVIRLCRCDFD